MATSLTRKPTLLTALLSVATIAGYVAYRITVGTDNAAGTAESQDAHSGHMATGALADSLPALVLNDLNGTPTALASFAGKPLLINFWATWCGPCRDEIPMLKTFHAEHTDIEVIGIAYDREEDVLPYAEEMQFNYPVMVGQTAAFEAMAALQNDSGALPFSVYVAADGAILGKHAGELHQEHLDNFVATLDALTAGQIDRAGARDMLAGFR